MPLQFFTHEANLKVVRFICILASFVPQRMDPSLVKFTKIEIIFIVDHDILRIKKSKSYSKHMQDPLYRIPLVNLYNNKFKSYFLF